MRIAKLGLSLPMALLVGVALTGPIPAASAATPQVGLIGGIGFETYSMSDVNDAIDEVNDTDLAGTGYKLDDIGTGLGFGGGLVLASDRYRMALEYTRLTGKSDLSVGTGTFEFNVPANAITLTGRYYFPTASKARFGIDYGVGWYGSAGSLAGVDTATSSTIQFDLEGSGFGFHGGGGMDAKLARNVYLDVSVGYRYAKTSDLEMAGMKLLNSDGSEATIDWSGLMTKAGIAVYFGGY